MKKVISILIVFVMVFMFISGTTVFADDVIAGNDVIERPNGPDTWTNFYIADRNNPFAEDVVMTGFSAYVARLSPFKFLVFNETPDGWEIVFESELVVPEEIGVYTEDVYPGILVPAGSCVGLYYPTNGAVPFDVDGTHFVAGDLTKAVLFTNNNNGAEFVDFYNSGDRIYSVQALGHMVPETGWLAPFDNENYRLNVKATLPIKFCLMGEYDDVVLMVNDMEVPIDFKVCEEECEEACDFYMGHFKAEEPGTYTAIVYVNGAPVLTKEFEVYENGSMGKGQMKANAKAKGLAIASEVAKGRGK